MITKKERLRKATKAAWHSIAIREKDPVPVFICGEMRSGTNMLTDCFDRSWLTAVFNETDDDAFEGYALLDNEKLSSLIDNSSATHVLFKAIADSARASDLITHFNRSRVVWIFRNPEDVVNSAMRKWTEHNKYLEYILSDAPEARWRGVNLSDELKLIISHHYERGISDTSARALIWYVRNRMFFEQNLQDNDKVLLVRYERLARNPAPEFRRIFDFVGMQFNPAYYKAVSTGSIRKNQPPVIDDEISVLCNDLRDKLIAELDKD